MTQDKTKKTDLELLTEWGADNKSSGAELLERHFATLYRFFINKVHESVVADLSQETLKQCVESRNNYRGESSFKTFLIGIARHKLLHHYRKKRRKEKPLDPLSDIASDLVEARGMSSLLAKRREQALILNALRAIAIDHQIILELFFWDDLTARECAEILQVPVGTTKSRLRRAKKAFKEALEKTPAPPQDKASITEAMGKWIMDIHDLISSKSPTGARKLREWDALDTDNPDDPDDPDDPA